MQTIETKSPLLTMSAAHLRGLIPLFEEREKLQAQLTHLDTSIDAQIMNPHRAVAITAKSNGKPGRGQTAAAIRQLLQSAGKEGMKVADIATALNKDRKNVDIWFYQNLTKHKVRPWLQKIGPGHFAIR